MKRILAGVGKIMRGWLERAAADSRLATPQKDSEELPAAVFDRELAVIAERRQAAGLPCPKGVRPSASLGLVGMCLSGGGIRSATFNLGVVQTLHKRGLWRFVDYLSTVSGGGYLGGALSSLYAHATMEDAINTLLDDLPEGAASRHLRDHSNYLLPRQFLAGLRLPGLFLRGLLVNLLILLPLIAAASLATLWIAGEATREASMTTELTVRVDPEGHSRWLAAGEGDRYRRYLNLRDSVRDYAINDELPIPDDVAILKPPRGVMVGDQPGRQVVVMPLQDAGRVPVTFIPAFEGEATLFIRAWQQAPNADPAAVTVDPVTRLHELSIGWLGSAVALVLLVLALYPVAQWLAERGRAPTWQSRDLFTRWVTGGVLLSIATAAFVSAQPLAIYYFDLLGEVSVPGVGDLSETMTLIGSVATGLGALFSGSLGQRAPRLLRRLGMATFAALGPLTVWLLYLTLTRWIIIPETAPRWLLDLAAATARALSDGHFAAAVAVIAEAIHRGLDFLYDQWLWPEPTRSMAVATLACAVFVGLTTRLFYDVNATSFHRFYRDRLSRAYLMGRAQRDGTISHADDLKLSALSPRAPYHLINATLNLQGSRRGNLRGRNAAFFLMSREYVGSQLTGYRSTEDMEALHPALDLGTAMAISGAAAAPNMGRATKKGLTFALTLLNVRLGYWLPHPRLFAAPFYHQTILGRLMQRLAAPLVRATPWHLMKEMLGQLDERGRLLNLSDGGHLENLGLYELLRRRCRLIIASDAEADPGMAFQGLADAIRLARIDLGVTIDIDIDAIRANTHGLSDKHGAVGRIDYGNGETGCLIYIKSSLTGDENVYVEKYKALDITFPHQTTADQFFDEEQFEAYRALGAHAADCVLAEAKEVLAGI